MKQKLINLRLYDMDGCVFDSLKNSFPGGRDNIDFWLINNNPNFIRHEQEGNTKDQYYLKHFQIDFESFKSIRKTTLNYALNNEIPRMPVLTSNYMTALTLT